MKKLVLLILIVCGVSVQAQQEKVDWMSMNEALAAQKKQPKNILMDAYTTWCGPCKMLDKNTFSDPRVAKYINEHFYAVKFNAEGQEEINYKDETYANPGYNEKLKGRNSPHQFARALQINAYPSIVFFNEDGEVIAPLKGYKTPEQIEIYLAVFAKDDYKKLTSEKAWEDYKLNFESTF
ncbi:thioredoxin family protein [Zunongwangia sp.]|uniref:thioredoxin family protein n=1 Tax=Zunongwangia sp. TaxID=1965325 RepID=UPI003AA94CCF